MFIIGFFVLECYRLRIIRRGDGIGSLVTEEVFVDLEGDSGWRGGGGRSFLFIEFFVICFLSGGFFGGIVVVRGFDEGIFEFVVIVVFGFDIWRRGFVVVRVRGVKVYIEVSVFGFSVGVVDDGWNEREDFGFVGFFGVFWLFFLFSLLFWFYGYIDVFCCVFLVY